MSALLIVLQVLGALLTRTVGGSIPADAGAIAAVEWIGGEPHGRPPQCRAESTRWLCWGVDVEAPGVVILDDGRSMWWRAGVPRASGEFRPARWGRMLVTSTDAPDSSLLRIAFRRPVSPPGRPRSVRLATMPVPRAHAVAVAPHAIWVAGEEVPSAAWIEIASDTTAPAFLALSEVAAVPRTVPLHVSLDRRRIIQGRVMSGNGDAAGGALITIFRSIDPAPSGRGSVLSRRVLAMEQVSDQDGRFELAGLGDGDYEAVAWHSQFGRASVAVPAGDAELVVRLRSPGIVRGRVLSGGRPAAGADVVSVPDRDVFAATDDMTTVKGGDARTGADGGFSVTVAERGGGELRIGGGKYPIRRIPLPSSPLPLLLIGDIELGGTIEVAVLLDPDPGCDLRAAGPAGRTGLQIVFGARRDDGTFGVAIPEPGVWEFTLVCRGEKRALVPSVVEIDAARPGKELRLIVR